MITLITGAPGSGKTLYCIDKIIRPLVGTSIVGTDANGQAQEYPREIFTNINGLKLPHQMVDAAWLTDLPLNKQTGAVVVFDEVQRVWPNRPTGSKKPPAVEYLETHRHDGIDVVLLTQNPQLLDPAVRALVGRHLHMRRVGGIGAAVVYEWDATSNALNFKAAFAKRGYRYSRRVFDLYESAKIHTKQTRSIPAAVWGIVIGLGAFAYFGPKFYDSIAEKNKAASVAASGPASAASAPSGQGLRANVSALGGPGGQPKLTAEEYRESMRPRMMGLPHTAPRYEQITAPTRAPLPAACIESKKKGCMCWTQDATRIFVPPMVCTAIVHNGYFVDFGQPQQVATGAGANASAVHWKADGGLLGGQGYGAAGPMLTHPHDGPGITAGEIARTSRATTGVNTWARNAVSAASAPAADPVLSVAQSGAARPATR